MISDTLFLFIYLLTYLSPPKLTVLMIDMSVSIIFKLLMLLLYTLIDCINTAK